MFDQQLECRWWQLVADREYDLIDLFNEQFPDLPCGEFSNPTVVSVENTGVVEFACNYRGYNSLDEQSGWTWFFDPRSREFFH